MVFQEGRRHLAMYNTPYGSMTIGVNTRHLLADLTERGGDIEIDYAMRSTTPWLGGMCSRSV